MFPRIDRTGWLQRSRRARARRPGKHGLRPSVERLEGLLLLTNFAVTNLSDEGGGSLRQAIESANADAVLYPGDADSIYFDLINPPPSHWTIDLQSPLPAITRPGVFVSGLGNGAPVGDPSRFGEHGVILDGSGVQGPAFTLAGSGDQVDWFYITGFDGPGVFVSGPADWVYSCTVANNSGDGIGNTGNSLTAEENLLTSNGQYGFQTTGDPSSTVGVGTGSVVTYNMISSNGYGGIETTGNYETYQANTVIANGGNGVSVDPGASHITLTSNYIGTNSVGTGGVGNDWWGIIVQDAFDVAVGAPGHGNFISGNQEGGVSYRGKSSEAGTIQGNFIGVAPDGTTPLGNGFSGVLIGDWGVSGDAPSSITVGGTTAGAGNVISANGNFGLWISGAGVRGVLAEGNLIGTDQAGNAALGNAEAGVQIDSGAVRNTIGGSVAGAENVISGNSSDGIYLNGAGTADNLIAGNLIGTDVAGTTALPNDLWGVFLGDAGQGNTVGGASYSEAANIISGNDQGGVAIFGVDAVRDLVEGNRIGTDISGYYALGNAFSGIYVGNFGNAGDSASDTTITGNLLSANGNFGLWITGGAIGTLVEGNIIGTNVTATAALGNAEAGVAIDSGASNNTIGGTSASDRNIITGNGTESTSQDFYENIYIADSGTSGNLVQGNDIGTNATGGTDLNPAYSFGLAIGDGATGNTIGGTAAGALNVVSGNSSYGVVIFGPGTSSNLLEGNDIGLDSGGEKPLGNASIGLLITDGATNNTIGGTSIGAGNLISGNGTGAFGSTPGVQISGPGTSGNLLEGNLIGTDASGRRAIGNFSSGVAIEGGAADNTIGGTSPGAGNLISGNGNPAALVAGTGFGSGVDIFGSGVTGNLVAGNLVGTDITGMKPLGNLLDGVDIQEAASGNTIGGSSAGAGNIIAFNSGNGVSVGLNVLDAALENAVLENSIFLNSGLGIEVDNTAPQTAPVLTNASNSASLTTITGTLSGARNTTFRIEFFSNPAGTSQGETYLGFLDVTTNGSGSASFRFSPASPLTAGLNITATATDPNGNTSEFSAAATVNGITNDLSVSFGGFVYNRSTRQFTETLTITNISDAAITGPIELVLVGLKNATLVNLSGTYQVNPYITILSSGSLGVGQGLTITLTFADPTLAAITYTPEFLAGPLPPADDAD